MSTMTSLHQSPKRHFGNTLRMLFFVLGVFLFSGNLTEVFSADAQNHSSSFSFPFKQIIEKNAGVPQKNWSALTIWSESSMKTDGTSAVNPFQHPLFTVQLLPNKTRDRAFLKPDESCLSDADFARHLPVVALAKTGPAQPCRVTYETLAPAAQKSARSSTPDTDDIPQPSVDILLSSTPVLPVFVLIPTARPDGTPLCYLPAARGLIVFSIPPPSDC